jgi:hypothetical protein
MVRTARLLLIVLVVSACAGSGSAPMGGQDPTGGGGTASGVGGGGSGQDSASGGTGNGSNSGGDGGNGQTAELPNGAFRDLAKIVYSGTMSVQVTDLLDAVRAGRDTVLRAGGYISGSRQANDGERSTASVTYRIPSDAWEPTLDALRGLGELIGEEIGSTEVTGQIVDLEARVRNLRIKEASVQAIAEGATAFEEILEGQERLSEVRGQIEQLEAQRVNLEDAAALGTLTVTYGTEVKAVVAAAEEAKTWNPGEEVGRATNTLVVGLQALSTAGIWFGIVWLPLLLFIGALFVVGRAVMRRSGLLTRLDPNLPGPAAPGG